MQVQVFMPEGHSAHPCIALGSQSCYDPSVNRRPNPGIRHNPRRRLLLCVGTLGTQSDVLDDTISISTRGTGYAAA
jgi:hypothetical protein